MKGLHLCGVETTLSELKDNALLYPVVLFVATCASSEPRDVTERLGSSTEADLVTEMDAGGVLLAGTRGYSYCYERSCIYCFKSYCIVCYRDEGHTIANLEKMLHTYLLLSQFSKIVTIKHKHL